MLLTSLLLASLTSCQTLNDDLESLARDHVNVAQRAWGYSSATASSIYQSGYEANNALDGRWSNRETDKWNSASGKDPHWLVVDLGLSFLIDAVVLRHEGVYGDGERYNTSDFSIQWARSPNGPWTDLTTPVSGNRESISLLKFSPIRCRFIRFITNKGEQNGNEFGRLFEIEVYSPKDKIDVPMIRVNWPDVPNLRHSGGSVQSAAEVHSLKQLPTGEFQVNGLPTTIQDGMVWLPVGVKQPATLTFHGGSPVTPHWTLIDDRSWLARMEGGAIHLLSSSHQDVAWIDTPDWCRENRIKQILEPAIDMMNRDTRYRFTMENMLNLHELLQERPERRGEIEKLIRNGQLEFGGTYNQPYESLLGGEQLIRQVYFGRRWLRKQLPGADTDIAYTVDVPGRSLQMQQILAKSGIRYLVTSRYHEGLFRWRSPDGSSILVYALPHYGNHSSLLKEEPSKAVRDLPGALKTVAHDFAMNHVPPHYMLLNSQDFESPVDFNSLLSHWSKQSAIANVDGKPVSPPTLDYSTTTALFHSLDTPGSKPKDLMGERPNMWLYIHGPTHHDAIQAQREASRILPVAETFATMHSLIEGSFENYPSTKLSNAWLDSLYPDHGFGGKNGHITDGVFHAKFASARDAGQVSLTESLMGISQHVQVDPSMGTPFVVFNPHGWERSDSVSVSVPEAKHGWIVRDSHGQEIESQETDATQHVNVATPTQGASVIRSTGARGERVIEGDWWDARKGAWESPSSKVHPATIVIDLGQVRTVHRILVRHYGSLGEFQKEASLNTRSYRILGATHLDGTISDVVPAIQDNDRPISVFEFAPTPIRYLSVQVSDPNQKVDDVARLLGVEVYANIKPSTPTVLFHASNLPSLGYRTFYLSKRNTPVVSSNKLESDGSIENDFYRIQLADGGLASIFDKQARRELFRKTGLTAGEVLTLNSVGNGAGEFGAVQQPTMEGFDRTSTHKPKWHFLADRSGPISSTYELTQPLGGTKVRQTLVIYHKIKRIELDIDLEGWEGHKYREFRLALPIGGPRAKVSYEVPLGTVEIGSDEVKSTGGKAYGSLDYWQQCSEIHPREVQDFISIHDGTLTTTVSSSVCVFDFKDLTGIGGGGPLIQPVLLVSRKSCHGEGNWYLQPGDHHFHFSLSSSLDPHSGWREASDAQLPLMAVRPLDTDSRLQPEMSFASVSDPNVRISTIKKAEDDDSVIVRCYDVDGKTVETTLKLFLPFVSAKRCNLIEDEQSPLQTRSGTVAIPVGRFSIETIKLKR